MTVTLSIGDIGLLILFCLAIALGVYIFSVLKNVNKLVQNIDELILKNKVNVTKTINGLPALIENATDVTVSAKEGIANVKSTLNEWDEAVMETVISAGDKIDSLGIYINTAADVAKIVIEFITNLRKK